MSARERVRRWVDGELDATERAALLADAERDPALARALADAQVLARALAELEPEGPPETPPDLVGRAVLLAVQRRAKAQAEAPFWLRWWRPRTVRLRVTPTAALVAVTAAALLSVWATRQPAGRWGGAQDAESQLATNATVGRIAAGDALVRLVVPVEGARSVAVAGDFNDWRTDDVFLEDPEGDGVFTGTLRLAPGSYAYMFVVDGERWVTDPYAVNHRDDGFGNRNAVLRID